MARILKTPPAIAKRAAALAQSKKAFDIVLIDLRKIKNVFTDFFVVCSCDSDTQVRAVASAVQDGLRESGVRTWHVEGETVGQWVLIDCVDVVIHVFHKTAREFYNLERLWGDVKITKIANEKESKEDSGEAPKKRTRAKRSVE